MIFIGYERGTKAYRAYDPVAKSVHVTRDVVFDEQAQWDWGTSSDSSATGENDDVFTKEYSVHGFFYRPKYPDISDISCLSIGADKK
jgi:hypothetical protein